MIRLNFVLLSFLISLSFFPTFIISEDENDPITGLDLSHVINLHESNITSEMKKYDLMYLFFYSYFCDTCKNYLSEFAAASKYFAKPEKNLTVTFARIDLSYSPNLTDVWKIKSYPSVFLVNKTEKILYKGQKSKAGLIKFIYRRINDDIFEIENLTQIEKFTNTSVVVLSTLRYFKTILFFSFQNYSKTNMQADFVMCLSEECLRKYGHNIVIYKPFDEKINNYLNDVGPVSQALPNSVQEFFATYGIEAGAPLTDNELNLMFENNRKMLFYARHSSNKDQVKYDSLMKELGLEFRSKKIYTSVMDIEGEEVYESVADIFGLAANELPALLYYDLKEDENNQTNAILYSIRNIKKEQLTKEYIKDYIKKVDDGKVKEDLFSEPPLESYDVSGLRYVIGRNYDQDVVENKNNVLIAFVERGNPVCERLVDMMAELTKKYPIKEKKIVFAFMDITRNQPRDIDTRKEGVPFVLLYANTMKDKPIFKLTHNNIGKIIIEEIEGFLYQSLNWGNQAEKKNDKNKENKKEDKKESDL